MLYSQHNYGFNTCLYGEDEWLFYKDYVIGRESVYVDGFGITPNAFYAHFYGPESRYAVGGNEHQPPLYDVIILETESEIVKHISGNADGSYYLEIRYYNNSEEYILEKFYKYLVTGLKQYIDYVNEDGLDSYSGSHIISTINYIEIEDLAIFKNLLFALHNYKFNNLYWINFFQKYLDYNNGNLNNAESLNLFTNEERKILELIINKEQNKQ
jgi:hypothetical protein